MFPEDDDTPPTGGEEQQTPPGGDAGTPPSGAEGEDEGPRESPFRQGMNTPPGETPPADDEGEEPPPEGEEPEAAAPAAKPKKVDPVEAAIAADGIDPKSKAAARIRELSKRPKPEEVAPLRDKAERFDNWNRVLNDTGSTNQQLSAALGYLGAINSRDPAR